jgi:feruloyl-CoA synthase
MDLKQTPFLKIETSKIDVRKKYLKDGTIHLKSTVRLKKSPHRMTERLIYWANKTPNKVFIGQRPSLSPQRRGEKPSSSLSKGEGLSLSFPLGGQGGDWQTLTYSETLKRVKSIAQYLLKTDVSPERPIAILSENSIEHGLIALAALHIGVPYSAIAPAYSLKSTDFEKLKHTIDLLTPALVFVQNGKEYEKALAAVAKDIPVVTVNDPLSTFQISDAGIRNIAFEDILKTEPTSDVDIAFDNITPNTIAKILFTSGSTGLPKGVINTHGNVTTNWQQITQTFPFMENGGLTFIDWLPWNHVFGGNHNFGLTLYNGGTLYIDEGNPTPRGIHKTIENLREIAPTMYCNVPKGFEDLIPFFKKDKDLREKFFSNLKLLFYAGAGMPQHVWDALEELAYETTGKRIMISSGLGMTEASPSCMFNLEYGSFSGMLGTPVAGLEMKLIPNGGKLEVRFKAPNITPGYWRNPEATAKAFDREGYYCTGDALKFVDENDPNKGMIFDGRIAEDFKLDTGTWVSVGVLKAKLITVGKGLIQDAVITGHDRPYLGAIVFPELNFCRKLVAQAPLAPQRGELDSELTPHFGGQGGLELVHHPSVLEALQTVLNDFSKQSTGSSTLIKKAVFADFNLSIDKGEITDKGSINQRMILQNYPEFVEMLYAEQPNSRVVAI